MKIGITGRIARVSAKRPWLTITAWAIALAGTVVLAGGIGDSLSHDDHNLVATQSDQVADLIKNVQDANGGAAPDTVMVFVATDDTVAGSPTFGDAAFNDVITQVEAALTGIDGVTDVTLPSADAANTVTESGHAAMLTATLARDYPDDTGANINSAMADIQAEGFTVVPYGTATVEATYNQLGSDTLAKGELIGIGVALIILAIVFGSLVAAGIPILIALVTIISTVGATALVGHALSLSFFIVNIITMLGLALGIDYSLVTVQRFREELAKGRSVQDAVAIAGNTANRAVLFSGITVVIALAGLAVVPSTLTLSLGIGAMLSAVMAVITALTLLPAVLRLLGNRVNRGKIRKVNLGSAPRGWTRIARGVTRRPVLVAIAGFAVMFTLAVPALSMRLADAGPESLPDSNALKQASQIAVGDFGLGQSATIVTVENAADIKDRVNELVTEIEKSDAFAETEVTWTGSTAFIEAHDVYDSDDPRAEQSIRDLRDDTIPTVLGDAAAQANVGGDQASTQDFVTIVKDAVPWVLLIVLTATFLLLLLAFRSIVVPLVAIGLNLLSTAATFGIMVAVLELGWGNSLLGLPHVAGISPWIPIFVFAVLFGLSMDYHVFLLTRIKEARDVGATTNDAVVTGLSRTGSLITGAAFIMVAVFAGFATSDLAEFAEMGFGLAIAVILDATVVRTLLVPAVMTMLGERNWYLPRWLEWLPQVSIEGAAPIEGDSAADGSAALEDPALESQPHAMI